MNLAQNSYTLLFVEDELSIRTNYVAYLSRFFATIHEAANGNEAYRLYREKKPDIMIVDINIPQLNGIELLQKIREHDHTTRAIMLTAHQDSEHLLKATELKLTKYIIKPANRDDLKEALNKAIQELESFSIKSKEMVLLKENYRWEIENRELSCNNHLIWLTNQERNLLALLLLDTHRIFTYDELIVSLWDDFESDKRDSLKTLVKNVRRKLPKDTIKNIFGIGYQADI